MSAVDERVAAPERSSSASVAVPHIATVDIGALTKRIKLPSARPLAERHVALTPEVEAMLAHGALCAISISGGKDSTAVAIAVARHLDAIGHTGRRVLVHSDLGRIEWKESLAECERLAKHLGWELIIVRRTAGDLISRWEGRWRNNVARYVNLECVRVILPWSTPSMRLCTSEFKTQLIARELRKRFPSEPIVNVTGIRRQESDSRAKAPVSAVNTLLARKRTKAVGLTWNAIVDYQIEDVFQEIADAGMSLHEAYTRYGVSRVSCVFCLAAETEVVTRDGIRPIGELAGMTPELLVPALNAYGKTTTNGSFKSVEVREFGTQPLLRIELATAKRQRKVVYATAEHRWFITSASARGDACSVDRTTVELQPGDRLKNLLAGVGGDFGEVPFATAQGFVFGDGTKPYGDRPASLTIYNNGNDAALLRYFAAHSIRRTKGGSTQIYGLPRTWKSLPDIRESRSFLLSWLAGYFAADGCVSKLGAARLDSASLENIRFARDIASICGVGCGPIRTTMRHGFNKTKTPLYSVNLTPGDLPEWFFVIEAHRERVRGLQENGRSGKFRIQWHVVEVTSTERIEPVYCAVVPEAQAFGLSDNLMTGNCIMSAYADLVAAAGCEDNAEVYRQLVDLEAKSGFGFQGNRWLADIAPHLLSDELRERVRLARVGAAERATIEKEVPKHLLYAKGWPTVMPSPEEAELIASVRRRVAAILGLRVRYTTGKDVLERYAELMALKAVKAAKMPAKKSAAKMAVEPADAAA